MFIDEDSRPMYQTLPQGVDAIFNCNTRSLPNPPRMPKWLKNGDPLPGNLHQVVFYTSGVIELTLLVGIYAFNIISTF